MKIGYQGILGNHSQKAAKMLVDNALIINAEYLPFNNSQNIVSEMVNGNINYGVLAVYNSILGDITESKEALKDVDYIKVTGLVMSMHQCIFKQNKSIKNSDINKIYSDIQTLKQTQNTVHNYFPFAKLKETVDSNVTAKDFGEELYDKYSAVICSKEAGESYGLELMYSGVQDNDSYRTMFILIAKK